MVQFYLGFSGRASRRAMWGGFLLPLLATLVGAFYADMGGYTAGAQTFLDLAGVGVMGRALGPAMFIALVVWAWPFLAIGVRRYHDRGLGGWRFFLAIALIVGGVALADAGDDWFPQFGALIAPTGLIIALIASVWFVFGQYLLPGQFGANRYGDDPAKQTY